MLTKKDIYQVTLLLLKGSIDTPNYAKMKLFWRILSRKITFENVMKMISECLRLQEIGANF